LDSKLPGLSIYWLKYHDIGIRAVSECNYVGAISSIYSMNALLPDEYRLSIDDDKFNEQTRTHLKFVCSFCENEIEDKDVRTFDLLLPLILSLCVNKKYLKAWNCGKCNESNFLEKTKFKKIENESPFYYKVIEQAPIRPDGISGRTMYHNKFVSWFYSSLEELDHQLGKYRQEYEAADNRDDVMDDNEENVQY